MKASEKGQGTVEFALVLSVILIIASALGAVVHFTKNDSLATHAARAASHALSVHSAPEIFLY